MCGIDTTSSTEGGCDVSPLDTHTERNLSVSFCLTLNLARKRELGLDLNHDLHLHDDDWRRRYLGNDRGQHVGQLGFVVVVKHLCISVVDAVVEHDNITRCRRSTRQARQNVQHLWRKPSGRGRRHCKIHNVRSSFQNAFGSCCCEPPINEARPAAAVRSVAVDSSLGRRQG